MEDDEIGYELVLAFDTDDPEFIRGFEAGKIWERLKDGHVETFTIHHNNAEMALRIAEYLGKSVRSEPLDDEFMTVEFR